MSSLVATKPKPFFLAGEATESSDVLEVKSPYDGEMVGQVYLASEEQASQAIGKAVEAVPIGRELPAFRKADILLRVSQLIQEHVDELAKTMMQESGKPIRDCRAEAARAVNTFRIASEEATRMRGELIPLDLRAGAERRMGLVRRFLIGPVFAITPFNFPLNLVAHKFAPAIAVGNPIILKPASSTPLTALLLGELLLEAGLPRELFSILPCSSTVAEPIAADDRIAMISFTGSDIVGWRLRNLAGRKRVVLELGGNAAVIVHKDADIGRAAVQSCKGGYYYAGQSCISVQRIYVHREVASAFAEKFLATLKGLKLGNPAEEDTDLGPMIDDGAAARADSWVQEAVAGGARVLAGGEVKGRMFPPTLLDRVTPKMKVSCKEVFAPIVVLYEYESFSEALAGVNDSEYGLQAGIFTRDLSLINQAFELLEVGGLIVNDAPNFRVDAMPYGGVKASGVGREGPRYAMEEMSEPRLLVLDFAQKGGE